MKSFTQVILCAMAASLFGAGAMAQQAPDVGEPWTANGKLDTQGDKLFGMQAGPIFSNAQAPKSCAAACNISWNGEWVTVIEGEMSICAGTNAATDGKNFNVLNVNGVAAGLEAGPIWDNDDAKAKCEAAFNTVSWETNNWITYVEGEASACACTSSAGYKVRSWLPNSVEQ